ncbi:MAG: hypothetical protein KF724_00040 [Phycisphaeraceae bacterium]|nr:hypothetical protein [Phycisphaeraceae bacterium]
MSAWQAALDWLLRLPTESDLSNWRITFERPMPAWLWLLLAAALVFGVIWSLRGVTLSTPRRVTVGALRWLLLMLLALYMSGPQLTLPRERTEPDWVLVLADRSRSLTIPDVTLDGEPMTRESQLARVFADHAEIWRSLSTARRVLYLGFDAGVRELATDDEGLPQLGESDGVATEIGPALSGAMERVASRPVSGVILLSDGRTTAAPDRALLRRLQAEGVRVHVVPLGSETPSGDHAVRGVEAPQRAFIKDEIPVEVDLDRSPTVGGALRVKLVDEATGRVLDARSFDDSQMGWRSVTLVGRADEPGERQWRVEIEPDGRDLIEENNSRTFRVEIVDRPMRVLYIEGYPRWEYRYLKNLLVRERGIESSVMLLSADRDFAQEGNAPISRLPRNAAEFAPFDLVILGDVPAGALSQTQMEAIREMVSKRGAGLLWIAGSRAMPRSWKGSGLEEVLPLRGSLELERHDEAVTMRPTTRADRLGLLRISRDADETWPPELASAASGWSRLEWAQRIQGSDLKPTAEVIAETASGDGGVAMPLLVSMRYGAGQAMYLATDETWRWRYGRGETLPERFWLQLLRHLARASIDGSSQGAILSVEPRRVEVGDPVRIEVTQLDLTRRSGATTIELQTVDPDTLLPTDPSREPVTMELTPIVDAPDRSATTYFPDRPGTYRITVSGDPSVQPRELEVVRRDLELAQPETDHALLSQIAEATGGEVLTRREIPLLSGPELLPNRAVTVEHPLTQPLWDTPLALILLIVIPAIEWSVRRWSRLA